MGYADELMAELNVANDRIAELIKALRSIVKQLDEDTYIRNRCYKVIDTAKAALEEDTDAGT